MIELSLMYELYFSLIKKIKIDFKKEQMSNEKIILFPSYIIWV